MWTYNYQINNNELYHHGVVGMKWGHRKQSLYTTGVRKMAGRMAKGIKSRQKAHDAHMQKYGNSKAKATSMDLLKGAGRTAAIYGVGKVITNMATNSAQRRGEYAAAFTINRMGNYIVNSLATGSLVGTGAQVANNLMVKTSNPKQKK